MQRARSRRQTARRCTGGQMTKAPECVRFNNEEPSAANICDSVQFACLADFGDSECSTPAAPQVLFVLAANEALEIDSPYHVARAHDIQRRKWNPHRGRPSVFVHS